MNDPHFSLALREYRQRKSCWAIRIYGGIDGGRTAEADAGQGAAEGLRVYGEQGHWAV